LFLAAGEGMPKPKTATAEQKKFDALLKLRSADLTCLHP
jgi:hypothetical protein